MKNQQGQTLILMLIVTVISLTIGVAISSRAISTLRQTSYTAQAGKAQKFADAGIEHVLGLSDAELVTAIANCNPTSHCFLDVDDDTYNDTEYYIEESGNGPTVEAILDKDQTIEIDLTGYGAGNNVEIFWVQEGTEETDKAALVLSFIYEDGVETKIAKHTFDPVDTRRTGTDGNNFGGPSEGLSDGDFVMEGITYKHKASLTTPSGMNKALRIRALYNETTNTGLAYNAGTSNNFPNQGYTITSTGTYGEAEWTAEVTKMNPALPAIFDFAIFSESDLTK